MSVKSTIISIIFFLALAPTAFAATGTASATPKVTVTPTVNTDTPVASSDAIKEELKARIKTVVQEKLDSTTKDLENKANSSILVGYLGNVTDIKSNLFNLDASGTPLQISLNENTTIIKDGKPIKIEQLSISDQVIVIGNPGGEDIIVAKRVVINKPDNTAPLVKKAILTSITKLNTKNKTFTITLDGKPEELSISKKLKLDFSTLQVSKNFLGIIQVVSDPKTPSVLLKYKAL